MRSADLEIENQLFQTAKEFFARSYSPYSKFAVGAAVYDASTGQMFGGTNIENAAYPSGLCAERVAYFSGRALNPAFRPTKIVIYTDSQSPVAPCGACLQVLVELSTTDLEVLLAGPPGIFKRFKLSELIPYSFDSSDLKPK